MSYDLGGCQQLCLLILLPPRLLSLFNFGWRRGHHRLDRPLQIALRRPYLPCTRTLVGVGCFIHTPDSTMLRPVTQRELMKRRFVYGFCAPLLPSLYRPVES